MNGLPIERGWLGGSCTSIGRTTRSCCLLGEVVKA